MQLYSTAQMQCHEETALLDQDQVACGELKCSTQRSISCEYLKPAVSVVCTHLNMNSWIQLSILY